MQEAKNGNKMQRQFSSLLNEHWKRKQRLKCFSLYNLFTLLLVTNLLSIIIRQVNSQGILQSDPRPTIYSGQVSFGLLLSAHSSLGAELSSSASQQVVSRLLLVDPKTISPTGNSTEPNYEQQPSNDTHTLATRSLFRRQIFERVRSTGNRYNTPTSEPTTNSPNQQQSGATGEFPASGPCSQVNANALYAGMGAIWASHQANLVGDSQLAIGTYVYDSCNDLDVGQRQSVRIVSNLNAFQQTTCEAPRGSPISLTIAHGDNQLRAIQLLTSFRVPVITTREHFALEEYQALTREQRRFLFSTAHSSRHLALGAIRFTKQLVNRSGSSPKLPNQFHRMSSRNALIVISRNLPERFVSYLADTIPNQVNYEVLQSSQPIEQIRSLETLESILLNGRKNREMDREESRIEQQTAARRSRRSTGGEDTADTATLAGFDSSNAELDGNGDSLDGDSTGEQADKMLSPTILMFITPAEAIDLITRLRNDLAEVSRYYSLIVSTREDISPALKTIFQRGGSRLCSGKPFFTISPRPDDIGEFSRYFRDTVQLEGDSSDHPLVCEFARYQANSRVSADLDDVSTEPVIKAVWAAAAAFKSVHKRECSAALNGLNSNGNSAGITSTTSTTGLPSIGAIDQSTNRPRSATTSTGGAGRSAGPASECMSKLGKNMSAFVQRALKRLNVTINSTGLQSLDGFQIHFDELHELETNRFSIRYISKECEITEIGSFTGQRESRLRMDEPSLLKSLEGSLPEPWPAPAPPSPPSPRTTPAPATIGNAASASSGRAGSKGSASKQQHSSKATDTESDGEAQVSTTHSRRKQSPTSTESPVMEEQPDEVVTRPSKSKKKRARESSRQKQLRAAVPLTAATSAIREDSGSGATETESPPGLTDDITSASGIGITSTRPGRTLKPFPTRPASLGINLEGLVPASASGLLGFLQANGRIATLELQTQGSSSSTTMRPSTEPENNSHLLFSPKTIDTKATLSMKIPNPQTTQLPVHSTLPESDGNADLEIPVRPSSQLPSTSTTTTESSLSTAASSTQATQDYVTAPSSTSHSYYRHGYNNSSTTRLPSEELASLSSIEADENHLEQARVWPSELTSSDLSSAQRLRLRSHIKWIYSSWYALSILGANICGALLTLYVLTFLLMKNCDGSLDRENQGIRSMHLLAIIVVFFGSTLFIVHPTPALCLLRNSWHNFALVLLFGSLLLQAMQTSSMSTIGLGGRPHRLNQFLTLLFMVGVQVSFELQRWRYESASYLNFVSQHLGGSSSSSASADQHKKLMMLSRATSEQLNPLSSFTDNLTPVSIQVSEHYQNLLQDYCIQQAEDFLQSQIYLIILVLLLIGFTLANRKYTRCLTGLANQTHQRLTSGKLVATSQHEANLPDLSSSSHFQLTPVGSAGGSASLGMGNLTSVSLMGASIYFVSLALHTYGQSLVNRDLVSSVTMVSIAFLALLGIFLPILLQIQRSFGAESSRDSAELPVMRSSQDGALTISQSALSPTGRAAFAMFPEFAPTGLRRPASEGGATTSAGSSSGASGSRRLFAETKESRRNMSTALAHLGPSEDSLRSMGFYEAHERDAVDDPPVLQERTRVNTSANNQPSQKSPTKEDKQRSSSHNNKNNDNHHHHHHHHHQAKHQRQQQQQQQQTNRMSSGGGEKRLIMLDVDPCCPRHGIGAWPSN